MYGICCPVNQGNIMIVYRRSPSSVKLHMRIKQSDDGRWSDPPAADSGPDQSFLLVMANDLDEFWTVLSIGLIHKALQVVFELPCEQKIKTWAHFVKIFT